MATESWSVVIQCDVTEYASQSLQDRISAYISESQVGVTTVNDDINYRVTLTYDTMNVNIP